MLVSDDARHARVVRRLAEALEGFHELKAGPAGLLMLRHLQVDPLRDPLFSRSRRWRSVTPYHVNRHRRLGRASAALAADVEVSCEREGLPLATVSVLDCGGSPRGLGGFVELTFECEIEGPLALGLTRHIGGGLFERVDDCRTPRPLRRSAPAEHGAHRAGKVEAPFVVHESRGLAIDARTQRRIDATHGEGLDALLRRAASIETIDALFDATGAQP